MVAVVVMVVVVVVVVVVVAVVDVLVVVVISRGGCRYCQVCRGVIMFASHCDIMKNKIKRSHKIFVYN